uniref:BEN domain-containing protein n=1 Tax=Leptobrachium leishanense TaxID=445787 RepID=A0A8C5LRK2_9ANUR
MSALRKDARRASLELTTRGDEATNEFRSLKMEEVDDSDDEPVLIESSSDVGVLNCLPRRTMLPVEHTSRRRDENRYATPIEYEGDGVSSMNSSGITHLKQVSNIQSDIDNMEEMGYSFSHKRKRSSSVLTNPIGIRSQEYDNSANAMYDYDAEYDAGSVISDVSYGGDQQRVLTEVLNYCQAMYDIVQKLDKKMDFLQRKVSDLHHVRSRPRPPVFPHRSPHHLGQGRIRLHRLNQRVLSAQMQSPPQRPQQPPLRMKLERNVCLQPTSLIIPATPLSHPVEPQASLSPPLPTIISTHSLQPSLSVSDMQHKLPENVVEILPESSCISASVSAQLAPPLIRQSTPEASFKEEDLPSISCVSSPGSIIFCEELATSSVPSDPEYDFLGDPFRNIKIPVSFLMKARQKTKPKNAARYLFRVVFNKETLIDCSMESNTQALNSLDDNKVSAIREFLGTTFRDCDLREFGKDWKACVTHITSMIRTLQAEAKAVTVNGYPNQTTSQKAEESICVDSDGNEDERFSASVVIPQETANPATSQPNVIATTIVIQQGNNNQHLEPILPGLSTKQPPLDPLEYFGDPSRNRLC